MHALDAKVTRLEQLLHRPTDRGVHSHSARFNERISELETWIDPGDEQDTEPERA